MSDDSPRMIAKRETEALATFDDVIEKHQEASHVIAMIVFLTPEGEIQIEIDANAHELIADVVERLQAVSRAIAN